MNNKNLNQCHFDDGYYAGAASCCNTVITGNRAQSQCRDDGVSRATLSPEWHRADAAMLTIGVNISVNGDSCDDETKFCSKAGTNMKCIDATSPTAAGCAASGYCTFPDTGIAAGVGEAGEAGRMTGRGAVTPVLPSPPR